MVGSNRFLTAFAVPVLSWIAASVGILGGTDAVADDSVFSASLRVGLCSQYNRGDMWLEFTYRIGNSAQEIALPVSSQSVDYNANVGTFSVSLPRVYGATPLNITARCRNSSGYSRRSNTFALSNCDFQKFSDSDKDGLPNNLEDTNCDGFFSPGDRSNPDNVDTDGDGVRDLVEVLGATNPTNPGSSPRPMVFEGGSFDPDGDGNSNPVVWRPYLGMWFVRDFVRPGNHIAFQFGLPGDVPFTYSAAGQLSDVGVVRNYGTQLFGFNE